VWKREVRVSLGGLSNASGFILPRVEAKERRSDTTFSSPLMCWVPRLCGDCVMSIARCRAAIWIVVKQRESGSTRPDLKHHPMAEVLSPNARMHWGVSGKSRTISHTLMIVPRNSNRLFTRRLPWMGLDAGILTRQALPSMRTPPMP
jgi:hypothetical protein